MANSRLSPRQQRFVQEYMTDLNATQAAIRAGYSARTADVQGPRLLGNVRIRALIDAAQEEVAERLGITHEYVLERLKENVERAMRAVPVYDREGKETGEYTYQGSVANGALQLLGKHLGMFVERTDHTTGGKPLPPTSLTVTLVKPQETLNGDG